MAGLAVLGLAGVAGAQPPSGIVRPDNEASLSRSELGQQLYAGNCSSCHGSAGLGAAPPGTIHGAGGIEGVGPPLAGVGARAADFYLRTGYMPLGDPDDQPHRRSVQFSERELDALIVYVASLGKGPPVPQVDLSRGSLSVGLRAFTEHCAGCHQVVAEGGVVTGAVAPPLDEATPTQIAEAVRIGPYVMPTFSEKAIPDRELASIIRYVEYAKNPQDEGGWGLGHIGPVPEGMVAWLLAGTVLVGVCILLGKRIRG
jgi:ubiquinol-cytochrome c reductase cytochrome c subunit